MKPRTVKLKVMDCHVEITGNRNVEEKAKSLLNDMLNARMKYVEVLKFFDDCDDETEQHDEFTIKNRKKKLAADNEYEVMYV